MSVEADRARLLALLRELSFERRKVVLASGKESDFYVDCKRTALTSFLEGGREAIEASGVPVASLFAREDFLA
jgi:hypothetical protein